MLMPLTCTVRGIATCLNLTEIDFLLEPVANGIQLVLERCFVLLENVTQRNGHMLAVFPLCALKTHCCLTRLTVELHHLQRAHMSNIAA